MRQQLFVFVGVAIILFAMLGAVQTGHRSAVEGSQNELSTEENWTADTGNVTTLSKSNDPDLLYNESVEARDENGTLLQEGSDYTWYENNGTIRALSGGELSDGENANVTYSTWEEQETAQLAQSIAFIPTKTLGEFLPFLAGIAMLFAAVAVFGGRR